MPRPAFCPGCHSHCLVGQMDPNCITLRRAFDATTDIRKDHHRRADGKCYLCLKEKAEPGTAVGPNCRRRRQRENMARRARERERRGVHV